MLPIERGFDAIPAPHSASRVKHHAQVTVEVHQNIERLVRRAAHIFLRVMPIPLFQVRVVFAITASKLSASFAQPLPGTRISHLGSRFCSPYSARALPTGIGGGGGRGPPRMR